MSTMTDREAFEAWHGGHYRGLQADIAWAAWQAALASRPVIDDEGLALLRDWRETMDDETIADSFNPRTAEFLQSVGSKTDAYLAKPRQQSADIDIDELGRGDPLPVTARGIAKILPVQQEPPQQRDLRPEEAQVLDAALRASAKKIERPQQSAEPVTDAMIAAYLEANTAYWKEADDKPFDATKPWRQGTPAEATRVSLEAALKAAPPAAQAEPVAWTNDEDLQRLQTGRTASIDVYAVPEALAMYGDQPLPLYTAPPAVQQQAEPEYIEALELAHEGLTVHRSIPDSPEYLVCDALIKCTAALAVERRARVLAAPPADDEAVRLLREARDTMSHTDLRDEIDAYLAKANVEIEPPRSGRLE